MSRTVPGVVVAVLLSIALGAAACSDGDGVASGGDRSSTTASTTTAPTAAPSSTEPDARSSPGCGSPAPIGPTDDPSGDVATTFDAGGTVRGYRLAVPASYDPATPTPLILNLHGSGSNAAQQSVYSQLPLLGSRRGAIVVSPDAIDGRWELAERGADDDFLMALLDDVEARYCVDLDRVHAAGISLGSWKASITACAHPERFASLVLVAEEVAPNGCALPVVAFHGTADRTVPYGEGADPGVTVTNSNAGLPGVEVNMPNWATNNGCSTDKDVVAIGTDVEHWTYRGCPAGTGVEFYSILHGGHTWPGSPVPLPGTTQTISATDVALDWFEAHPQVR